MLDGRWLVLAVGLLTVSTSAQTAATSADQHSLNSILMRLQIRHWEYVREIPDFFAEETVYSDMNSLHANGMRTVTESIFRLRRGEKDVFPPELFETRVVRRFNGSKSDGDALTVPSLVVGVFSNGLGTVTLEEKRCYDFHLVSHRPVHRAPVFEIDYRMKPEMVGTVACGPWPDISGYAIVDATSFEMLTVEMKVPHYLVNPGVHGTWRWWIDYAPVIFDGRRFSMPKKIQSEAQSDDGRLSWSFVADYRNYHKTDVKSRIIENLNDATPH